MDSLNQFSRLRDDAVQLERYDAQSAAPFNYLTSFGNQAGCAPQAYQRCRAWAPGAELLDASNSLRFGEPFETYEPGHPVSTELVGRSPYIGRGEGILTNIDTDSALRSNMSNPGVVRARKLVTEKDLFSTILPPLDIRSLTECEPYRVVVDDASRGMPTRVVARNAKK